MRLARVLPVALAVMIVAGGCGAWLGAGKPTSFDRHVVVVKSENALYLWDRYRLIRSYDVATGREPDLTPEGRFEIVVRHDEPGEQLGARWLGLGVPGREWGETYGIHGTDDPESIGQHASSGCIRMHDRDVIDLDERIGIGTVVVIRP